MEYLSSPNDIRNFMKSVIWQDFQRELLGWLKDIHIGLEDPDTKTSDKLLHRLGGNAETIRRVLEMPKVIIMNIEDDLQTTSKKER